MITKLVSNWFIKGGLLKEHSLGSTMTEDNAEITNACLNLLKIWSNLPL